MKIKKFKNLWTMGLILFGVILGAFWLIKFLCPQWIVGVAEISSIVAFGNFIDSNKFLFYIFDSIVSFLGSYVFCCACCRKKKLNAKSCIVIILEILILKLVYAFIPSNYIAINYCFLATLPFATCFTEKNITRETFISSTVCVFVDIMAQVMSITIRDVVVMSTYLNSVTFIILLIDTWIWRFLLYFFFNYKNIKKEF